jgi:hypothetical protein
LPDVSDLRPASRQTLDRFAMMRAIETADHRQTLFISLKTLHLTDHRPAKGIKKDPAKSRVKNRD